MSRWHQEPLAERFWPKVQVVEDDNACWLWMAARDTRGYGRLYLYTDQDGKKHWTGAHRVAYALSHDDLTDELDVCHTCDNPPCVRFDHLFLGTMADNMRDCAAKHRQVFQRHPERAPRGARNARTKLTEAQVVEIRARLAAGEPALRLAPLFSVSPSMVLNIKHRRWWRHVPE